MDSPFTTIVHHGSREVICAAYDKEIARALNALLALKAKRNSAAPISILPDEILSLIFLHYDTVSKAVMKGHWVRLMLVCRRWRTICLNHAKLWSFISPGRSQNRIRRSQRVPEGPLALPIGARIQRSAQAPLTCDFHLSSSNLPEFLDVLRGNSHRIGRLHLVGHNEVLDKAFSETADLTALEGLELEYKDSWQFEDDDQIESRNWTLSEAFMDRNGQRLRSFRLRAVQLADNTGFNILTNLTSLELSNDEDRSTAILPSLQDVVSLVLRSPRLTSLRLTDYWSENETEIKALNPFPPMMLSHLERLVLNGGADALTLLARSLVIPPAASLNFFLRGLSDGESIRKFIVPLRHILHRPGAPIIRCIDIEPASHCHSLRVFSEDIPRYTRDHPSTLLEITFSSSTFFTASKMFVKFIHMLPIHPSSNLSLFLTKTMFNRGERLSLTTWKMLWRALPQLKRVSIGLIDGMDLMLQGLIAVLEGGVKGTSGRRRRRLARTAPLTPSTLSLQPRYLSVNGEEEYDRRCFECLVESLKRYRDMELVGKPSGVAWDTVIYEHVSYVRGTGMLKEYWARLKDVTKTLKYEGENAERDGLV